MFHGSVRTKSVQDHIFISITRTLYALSGSPENQSQKSRGNCANFIAVQAENQRLVPNQVGF